MYEDFALWLDRVLEAALKVEAAALNFNLYDDEDNNWAVQLIATPSFDPDDEEYAWCCEEAYTSGEDLYTWEEEASWIDIQQEATELLKEYLDNGKYAEDMKKYQAIGIGFVDGDLTLFIHED